MSMKISSFSVLFAFALLRSVMLVNYCYAVPQAGCPEGEARRTEVQGGSGGPSEVVDVQACPLFLLNVDYSGFTDDEKKWQTVAIGDFWQESGQYPSCIEQELEHAQQSGCREFVNADPDNRWNLEDDCWGYGYFMGFPEYRQFVQVPTTWKPFDQDCVEENGVTHCYASGFLLDDQCNSYVGYDRFVDACNAGIFTWSNSPISLLWEKNYDIEGEVRLSQFPLEPSNHAIWNLWKASAKAPLLVYDPEHAGQITSARQLFGNWTFGGRRLASLLSSSHRTNSKIPDTRWENGYEALATLDENGDSQISGRELDQLGLWFDENRDGISQTGEVKSLKDVSITALYYTPDRQDSFTKSIFAKKGYERLVDGKPEIGSSVDWYGEGGTSQFELISKHFAQAGLCKDRRRDAIGSAPLAGSENAKQRPNLSPTIQSISSSDHGKPYSRHSIDGLWRWSPDVKQISDRNIPGGYLLLNENDTQPGTLSGLSFVEIHLAKRVGTATRMVRVFRLKGDKQLSANDEVLFHFEVFSKDGTSVKSVAKLAADGATIRGRSTAVIVIKNSSRTLTYDWVAVRTAPQAKSS